MKKGLFISLGFLFLFLILVQGGWLPTDVRIDSGTSISELPQISCDGDNIFVVWNDWRNFFSEIYFNYSEDAGLTWQGDSRINNGEEHHCYMPQISNYGPNIFVVWEDERTTNYIRDIYFNYSHDNGATWNNSDSRLNSGDTPGTNTSKFPQIASFDNRVYVVWQDERNGSWDIYFNHSTDYGVTWQNSDIRIDTGDSPGASSSESPQICCNGNNVYVAWQDNRNSGDLEKDIYFNYSIDGGATWQASDLRLNAGDSPGASVSEFPQISCEGNSVYVVWHDKRNGETDVYFNYSADNGAIWQTSDIRLDTGDTAGDNSSSWPCISSGGNNVYVAWQDTRNLSDIYFNYSEDRGNTWQSSDIRLNAENITGPDFAYNPKIASKGNYVFVVWSDLRNGWVDDIYFNCSLDGGANWNSTDIRVDTGDTPGGNDSWLPQIEFSGRNVYFVWQDERNSDWDIYFNAYLSESPNPVTYRALLVGISVYDKLDNLKYADDDANDMFNSLIQYPNWESGNIEVLTDAGAGKFDISGKILDLEDATDDNDVFLFFFSGHGTAIKSTKEPYLCPHDFDESDTLSWINIKTELLTWLNRVPGKKVVILDACLAGNFSKDPDVQEITNELDKSNQLIPILLDVDIPSDFIVMTGAKGLGKVYEHDHIENGLFPWCIMRAWQFEQDDNTDGNISAEETFQYADTWTNLLTLRFFKLQDPQIFDNIPGELPLIVLDQ